MLSAETKKMMKKYIKHTPMNVRSADNMLVAIAKAKRDIPPGTEMDLLRETFDTLYAAEYMALGVKNPRDREMYFRLADLYN